MNYKDILFNTLKSAEDNNFSGYSKFDALNSPLLNFMTLGNKWLTLGLTQLVKQSPFHIRPFLGVKKSRNPKGIALFVRSYLVLFEFTKDKIFLSKAIDLLDWLIKNSSPGEKHKCWGYNYIWQNTIFLQQKNEPNAVVTTFVGEAFLEAYKITKNPSYLDILNSISLFLCSRLPVLFENDKERAISYVCSSSDAIVLNVQVITASLLIKIHSLTKKKSLRNNAIKQYNYTINKITDYHAWFYTYPSNKSPITHDNYHTAFILDAILEYFEETGDDRFMNIYYNALGYYTKNLFLPTGAPKWMYNKNYPNDIHGSASGIITFSKASKYDAKYLTMAKKVLDWTIKNLYRDKNNDFIYRKGKYLYWNYSLMRWCNAWMCYAISEFILLNKK
tara:strand:- start:1925 stop:3094 length:1170 start_codon:yes stop_codon:yes gene_type:complete